MKHPEAFVPQRHSAFRTDKMGKSTLFMSERMMVGLNAFEPGQEHALHAHAEQDKMYLTLDGSGHFLLDGEEIEMEAGQMLVAPEGIPHGIRNTSDERLIVLVVMAPAPG